MAERPRVGVGVILVKGENVLLGKRKNAHGEGAWCCPGGHLEYGESIENCVRREVLEETGLTVANIRKATFTNDIFDAESKHYVTLFMVADYVDGEPVVRELNKCEEWRWCRWSELPAPLFLPIENLLRNGFNLSHL